MLIDQVESILVSENPDSIPWRTVGSPVGITYNLSRNVSRGIPLIEYEPFEDDSVSSFSILRGLYAFGSIISRDFTWILDNPPETGVFVNIFDYYDETPIDDPASINSTIRIRFRTNSDEIWQLEILPVIIGGSWSDYFDMKYTYKVIGEKYEDDPPLCVVPFVVYMPDRAKASEHFFFERIS